MSFFPRGRPSLLEVTREYGPIKLLMILSSVSMMHPSIRIEFSIFPLLTVTLFPRLVYGPMYTRWASAALVTVWEKIVVRGSEHDGVLYAVEVGISG